MSIPVLSVSLLRHWRGVRRGLLEVRLRGGRVVIHAVRLSRLRRGLRRHGRLGLLLLLLAARSVRSRPLCGIHIPLRGRTVVALRRHERSRAEALSFRRLHAVGLLSLVLLRVLLTAANVLVLGNGHLQTYLFTGTSQNY